MPSWDLRFARGSAPENRGGIAANPRINPRTRIREETYIPAELRVIALLRAVVGGIKSSFWYLSSPRKLLNHLHAEC